MFQDRKELVEEVQEIFEVKTMLRTSIEKYGDKLIQEGIIKGKLESARNFIKRKYADQENL